MTKLTHNSGYFYFGFTYFFMGKAYSSFAECGAAAA